MKHHSYVIIHVKHDLGDLLQKLPALVFSTARTETYLER